MEKKVIYDVIVVGSGARGSTVAHELSKNGLKVLILEKGGVVKQGAAVNQIKNTPLKLTFEEDGLEDLEFFNRPVELMYMEGIGGTTPVSLANACYACTSCYKNSATTQFKVHDIELFKEFLDVSKELNVGILPREMMGPATLKIISAGEKLGHQIEPMPKFINFEKCDNCGSCIQGCTKNAKWDGADYIQELKGFTNAEIIQNFKVTRILHEKNTVTGVEGLDHKGEITMYHASKVVVSAGALNTPKILSNSEVASCTGGGLFTDLFMTVGGYLKDIRLNHEIPMGVKSEFGPYFISPHYSSQLIPPIREKGFDPLPEDVMGFMVKIADDANGKIMKDGNIYKKITKKDAYLLKEGYMKSIELLKAMGVEPSSISTTAVRGAHPGGTAAIGKVVDKNLETSIYGLYVADASVIPQAPGRPPILTIAALAKKVSENITFQFSANIIKKV